MQGVKRLFGFVVFLACMALMIAACDEGDKRYYYLSASPEEGPSEPEEPSPPAFFAGAGRADITPHTGIVMMGYADSAQIANGYHTRLYARALVLKDKNNTKLALVQCDLLCVSGGIHRAVAKSLADIGIDEAHLLISATHTHSGPSAFFPYYSFNFPPPPVYDPSIHDFLVTQITKAVREADNNLKPAKLAMGYGEITETTKNRSLAAHLANYGIDISPEEADPDMAPGGRLSTIDPVLTVIRVDQVSETGPVPIGVYTNFAIHGTSIHKDNLLYSGDNQAAAERFVENSIKNLALKNGTILPEGHEIVCVWANGNEGDMSPGVDEDFTGKGFNAYSDAEISGAEQAEEVLRVYKTLEEELNDEVILDSRFTYINMAGQEVEGTNGERLSPYAAFGVPFVGGAEDGPTPIHDMLQTESGFWALPVDLPFQGNKVPLFVVPPGTFFPDIVPFQVMRINDLILAAIPGEPTKETGSRIKKGILDTCGSFGISHVAVVGLANEFMDYVTTPEEYSKQHYEGAQTILGPLEDIFVKNMLVKLARRLVAGEPAPWSVDPSPEDEMYAGGTSDEEKDHNTEGAGEIVSEPDSIVQRFNVVSFSWVGGHPEIDHHPDEDFVVVERKADDNEAWEKYLGDEGLEITVRNEKADENLYHWCAHWDLTKDVPEGRYRFVVYGKAMSNNEEIPYEIASNSFTVGPSDALGIEDIVKENSSTFIVKVMYPDPDPAIHFRMREKYAKLTSVTVALNGKAVNATLLDPSEGKIQLEVSVKSGDILEIPSQGAYDPFGNYNSEGYVLEIE
ncbi:MAG: neutral/alkaline non-lysosomal ceramidase N-terminal domain-containing protein [Deltaproteobacteria bacterium]|nr:neutral/alkaline non-lysosomal ceramidase N-terminal domain-containing protein [Deltaproteobacteria bacterium]